MTFAGKNLAEDAKMVQPDVALVIDDALYARAAAAKEQARLAAQKQATEQAAALAKSGKIVFADFTLEGVYVCVFRIC
jgi:uncharacterized protein YggE